MCARPEAGRIVCRRLARLVGTHVLEELKQGAPDAIVFDVEPGYFDAAGVSFGEFLRKDEELSRVLDSYRARERHGRFEILCR